MPLTATATFTAELCETCILVAAGYTAHELGLSEDTIEKALARLELDGTAIIDAEGVPFFSKLNCEGCGGLPGTRETATITTFERNTK